MGTYDTAVQWEPTEMVIVTPAYEDQPARVAWSGAGIVSTEFARQFAWDLLMKCERADKMNEVDTTTI